MKHVRISHESDSRFVVYCSICGRSFKKWPTSVKIHGIKYSANAIIRITSTKDENFSFSYARIKEIYVHHDQKLFITSVLHVEYLSDHDKSYVLSDTLKTAFATYHDLYIHGVLHSKIKNTNINLVEKFFIIDNTL